MIYHVILLFVICQLDASDNRPYEFKLLQLNGRAKDMTVTPMGSPVGDDPKHWGFSKLSMQLQEIREQKKKDLEEHRVSPTPFNSPQISPDIASLVISTADWESILELEEEL